MVKHLNITVKGIVQGVFFRKFTKIKADELGITGTVRNTDSGSVFIEAEGEEESLKEFLEWCHTGPEKARVESVSYSEASLKRLNGFSIIR
jgi:acylphosphatase